MRRHERGMSMAVEATVLIPGIIVLILLGVALTRLHLARQAIETAASSAAREASIARSVLDARARAHGAASNTLGDAEITCTKQDVNVDAAGLRRPIGAPASVSVTVTCTVPLADIALPGLPGQLTFAATRSSPVDAWRGR